MAQYLSSQQEQAVARLLDTPMARTEWPTWLLIVLVYGAWLAGLLLTRAHGLVWGTPLLILATAWYMSLQHELVHGHPTRLRWLNKLLGYAPLAAWFPFTVYLESHLRHHHDADLTLPGIDPETHYVSQATWQRSGGLMRALFVLRKSFWGRLLVGPAMAVAAMLREALGQLRAGELRHLPMWGLHLAALAALLWLVERVAGIAPWYYLLAVAYPALALVMVRSYYEHRAAPDCKHRTVLNEAAWPMRLLYLNNNYHLVHHDLPALPWYLLGRVYRADRAAYFARSGGFRIGGYAQLAWRFGFRAIDAPVHPYAPAAELRGHEVVRAAGPPPLARDART